MSEGFSDSMKTHWTVTFSPAERLLVLTEQDAALNAHVAVLGDGLLTRYDDKAVHSVPTLGNEASNGIPRLCASQEMSSVPRGLS